MCADVVGEEVGVEGGRDTDLFLALVKLCSGMATFSVAYVTAAPSLSACKGTSSLCLQYTITKLTYNHLPASQYMCTTHYTSVTHPVLLLIIIIVR